MKNLFLIIFLLSFAVAVKAQKADTTIYLCTPLKYKGIQTIGSKDSLSYFDSCPEFPGGDKAFNKFLIKNLK